MNLRLPLALLLAAHADAQGQQTQPAAAYKLRNAAAADVAKALTAPTVQPKLEAVFAAEPATNILFVTGDAAVQKRVTDLLTGLDKETPRIDVAMRVVELPAGFAKDVGLEEGGSWTLTPREARMLTAAMRRDKGVRIKSEPRLVAESGRQAVCRNGEADDAWKLGVLSCQSAKGGPLYVEVDATVTKPAPNKGTQSRGTRSSASVPDGGALVVRIACWTAEKADREMFVVVTPSVVEAQK